MENTQRRVLDGWKEMEEKWMSPRPPSSDAMAFESSHKRSCAWYVRTTCRMRSMRDGRNQQQWRLCQVWAMAEAQCPRKIIISWMDVWSVKISIFGWCLSENGCPFRCQSIVFWCGFHATGQSHRYRYSFREICSYSESIAEKRKKKYQKISFSVAKCTFGSFGSHVANVYTARSSRPVHGIFAIDKIVCRCYLQYYLFRSLALRPYHLPPLSLSLALPISRLL